MEFSEVEMRFTSTNRLPFDRQGVLHSSTLYKASLGTLRVRRSFGLSCSQTESNPAHTRLPRRDHPGRTRTVGRLVVEGR